MDIERELRKNVKDLQEQLQRAYRRIKTLQDQIHSERRQAFYNDHFSSKNNSGWAMMDSPPEYPEEYLEEGHKEMEYPTSV